MTCTICNEFHPTFLHDPSMNSNSDTQSEEEPIKISSCSVQYKGGVGCRINGTTEQSTTAVDGLTVRFATKHANIHSSSDISMPTTFGFDGLPLNKDEIPAPSNLKHWNYLKRYVMQFQNMTPTFLSG